MSDESDLSISEAARQFLAQQRVARLATADGKGQPHVVPVCYALAGTTVYVAIDEKPKSGKPLKRLRNITENPHVAMVADHYDDRDWSRLGWVMLRGEAEILQGGSEHGRALGLLRGRYPQYRAMTLEGRPVIAIRVRRARVWGTLEAGEVAG